MNQLVTTITFLRPKCEDVRRGFNKFNEIIFVWYSFIKFEINKNIRLSSDNFESDLQKMHNLNKIIHPEISKAKQNYILQAKQLNPVDNIEQLTQNWEDYNKKLRHNSMLPNNNFESYETWRLNHNNQEIQNYYLEHKGPKILEKEFVDSGESDFETFKKRRLEEKARDLYNAHKDLQTMNDNFGMFSSDSNPFTALNDIKKRWAENVANYYADKIPFTNNANPSVKLFTGFPGAGKSKFIEPNQTQQFPLRSTDYGLLIDGDEYQKYIPGWQNGAGSVNTLAYTQSIIKSKILKEALEKGNNVVIPIVAGNVNTILNEVVNQVIKNLKVDVIVVPTDVKTSHQRVISRSEQDGERLIAPAYNGDPMQALIQARNIINNPNYENIDEFTKKILSKLGYNPTQMRQISLEEKQKIHNQYASLVTFEVAQ